MASAPLWITAGAFSILILYKLIVELSQPVPFVTNEDPSKANVTVTLNWRIPTMGLPTIVFWLILLACMLTVALLTVSCMMSDMAWCYYLAYFFALLILALVLYVLYWDIRTALIGTDIVEEESI